jgi:hypothetical protein
MASRSELLIPSATLGSAGEYEHIGGAQILRGIVDGAGELNPVGDPQ